MYQQVPFLMMISVAMTCLKSDVFYIIIPNQSVCDRTKMCMLETICDKFELNS